MMPKTRKQHETFYGDGYILEYTLINTKWAGDNDTPPAEEWEIENVSIQKENHEHFDLPIEFIERFNINDKLINYDY
jgi:hypothetical protein